MKFGRADDLLSLAVQGNLLVTGGYGGDCLDLDEADCQGIVRAYDLLTAGVRWTSTIEAAGNASGEAIVQWLAPDPIGVIAVVTGASEATADSDNLDWIVRRYRIR